MNDQLVLDSANKKTYPKARVLHYYGHLSELFPAEFDGNLNSPQISDVSIGGVEIIEKLFAEWTELCEEGASNEPFFRPEWFAAFVANFEKEILLVTVRRGGKLRAVLPLVKKSGKLHGVPVKKLQAVFNLNTQRFDLIHGADETEREEIVKAVWNEIKKQMRWDVLEMRMVRKDSWLDDLLVLAEKENYRTGIWQMDSAPFVRFPQAADQGKIIEEYFAGLKKRFRQDLNRRLRRLKELGKVEFAVTRGYRSELLEKYFDLEGKGWKGQAETAAHCDPRAAKLHHDFARAAAAANALFIYELKFNDETIAMCINIMYDRRRTVFWKTAYDENYARFSPGNLLIEEFLADCVRNGSSELDMLSPPSPYKGIWASGESEHAGFYVFRRGFFGRALWKWKFNVIGRLRKLKNRNNENHN